MSLMCKEIKTPIVFYFINIHEKKKELKFIMSSHILHLINRGVEWKGESTGKDKTLKLTKLIETTRPPIVVWTFFVRMYIGIINYIFKY